MRSPPSNMNAALVTATGTGTPRTLADWMAGQERGTTSPNQVEYVQSGTPEFGFDLFDSGFIRYAQFSERHTLPGPHVGVGYAAHHIDVLAEGSGANLPTSNDIGLSLSFRKDGYDTSEAATGEMDAIWINVIQGGPDAPATGETRSAAGCVIGSLQSWGQVGYSTFAECDTAQKNRDTGVIEHNVKVYIASLDINTETQTGHGIIADARVGALDAAFLARSEHGSQTGTWDYLFQGSSGGVTTFSVSPAGVLTCTDSITVRNSGGNRNIFVGAGTPEGAVTASGGALFLRSNGNNGISAYVKVGNDSNTGWRPLLERLSGTTEGRPANVNAVGYRGYMYFDTTLGIPIWWAGAGWVDATGATV